MTRPVRLVLASLLVTLVATSPGSIMSAGAATVVPSGFRVELRSDVAPGVEHVRLVNTGAKIVANVAHITPGFPTRMRQVLSNDKVMQKSLEKPSALCKRVGCFVGINGDFMKSGVPLGGVVRNGELWRSPNPTFPQLSVKPDGTLTTGTLKWGGALILAGGRPIGFSGVNVARGKDALVLYTPAVGTATPVQKDGVELVLRVVNPGPVKLGLDKPVQIVALRNKQAGAPLPVGTFVLSGTGRGASILTGLWNEFTQGLSRSASLRTVTDPVVVESIGGGPTLLRGGANVATGKDSFATGRNPRSMIGWNAAGDAWIVAIDGRQPASVGMSLAAGANFLRSLGATDGFNFDGGGGTELVVKGVVVNKPNHKTTKKPVTKIKERPAVNAWVVVAR